MAGFDRFGRVWANKGAISAPNITQFDQGFSFLGNTPPSVELFNAMFQERDEQLNWIYAQLSTVLRRANITPAATPDTQVADAMARLFGSGAGGASWVRLPGGAIMQWGSNGTILAMTPSGVGESFADVVFPIAFPTACTGIQATPHDLSGAGVPNQGAGLQETAWVLSKGQTGARVAASARASGVVLNFDWLALGF